MWQSLIGCLSKGGGAFFLSQNLIGRTTKKSLLWLAQMARTERTHTGQKHVRRKAFQMPLLWSQLFQIRQRLVSRKAASFGRLRKRVPVFILRLSYLPKNTIWNVMKELTPGKSLSNVTSANTPLPPDQHSITIKRLTPTKKNLQMWSVRIRRHVEIKSR